jgi:hypothetical protein
MLQNVQNRFKNGKIRGKKSYTHTRNTLQFNSPSILA